MAEQSRLLRLLGATVPATLSFAVRQLAVVRRAGALDDEAFLAACPPALIVPAKNTPLAVLRFATAIADRRPGLARQIAEAAAAGLEHRHRDVQSASLALLRHLAADDLVVVRLDLLEPTVAREAADWLGTTEMPGPARHEPTAAGPRPALRVDDRTAAERAAALLAGETDPWEIERLLATIAAGTAAGELAALTKPARRALRDPWTLRHAIAGLLLNARVETRAGFLGGRLAEMQALDRPETLLATPTDPSGWLDAGEFVGRLAGRDGEPGHFDLIAGLLRLHPDGRDAALRAARGLPGDAGAAVRYALGGRPEPVGNSAVWVAAARSRAPFDDHPHLIRAGLGGAGRGHAARYALRLEPLTQREPARMFVENGEARTEWRTVTTWTPCLEVQPPASTGSADQPTVLAPGTLAGGDPGPPTTDWVRWQAQIWPHDAEPFLAGEIQAAMHAAYWEDSGRTARIVEALVAHPGRLGTFAASVLAAGLTAHDAGCRVRAAEAFGTLVPRRLDPAVTAAAMADLAGHATATRWATALRATAQRDSGASRTVVSVLGLLLPQLPHQHRGLHALLGVLLEEMVRVGAAPESSALRPWLLGFTGSSAAAKTARALLSEIGDRP